MLQQLNLITEKDKTIVIFFFTVAMQDDLISPIHISFFLVKNYYCCIYACYDIFYLLDFLF